MRPRLLVVGSTNVDLSVRVPHHPAPGETVLGDGGDRSPGGKGANQALAAALQGAEVVFVGAVGDGPDAQVALAGLRAAGVDLTGVVVAQGRPTGLAVITVADDGQNTIVVVPGANASVSPAQAEDAVRRTSPGDILLLQGELPRPTTEAAARAAVVAGRRLVLNVAPWGPLDADVLITADPLVLNEHEATQAVEALGPHPQGQGLADPDGAAGRDRAAQLATALRAAGTPSVVLTLGAAGAVLADADGTTLVPTPAVDVVDTTGAGDAFTGALAARLLAGDLLADAVRHAVRVGAHAVQHQGAQRSYPSLDSALP